VAIEDALLPDHSVSGKFLQEDPPKPGTNQDSILAVDAWI